MTLVTKRKPIPEMTDREMLIELLQEKRRAENLRWVRLGVVAALVLAIGILCAVYLPPVIRYFRKLNELLERVPKVFH